MIKIDRLSKKFNRLVGKRKKEEFYADYDISFEAKEGEILGVLGPNGAGKTTLLRMIAGIMKASSGSIEIDNLRFIIKISPLSYIYSAIITTSFAFIVNKVIHFVLKKIDMIESLKSVE